MNSFGEGDAPLGRTFLGEGHVLLTLNRSNEEMSVTQESSGRKCSISQKERQGGASPEPWGRETSTVAEEHLVLPSHHLVLLQ